MNSKKKRISEATSDSSGGRGSYVAPLQLGLRPFKKDTLAPFTDSVSDYDMGMFDKSFKGMIVEEFKSVPEGYLIVIKK